MKRIACALLFAVISGSGSFAQIQRSANRGLPEGDAAWPSAPAPAAHSDIPAGPMISVNELRIPVAAQKELQRFQQSLKAGNMQECVKHLTKALEIYPQMAKAHQNLGACYVRLNEYEKAVTEFQTASEMDTPMIQPELGLAGAYLVLGRYPEAEAASRRAVDIDPANSMGRYLLGRSLVFEGRDTPEAERLLRESFDRYPDAHLELARILLKRNDREEAVAELREYVRQPNLTPKNRQAIGCAIEKLTQHLENLACTWVPDAPAPAGQD
jgi:tetratricopeptide (TPR) repeat protein